MTQVVTPDLGILLALAHEGFVEGMREHMTRAGFQEPGRADGFILRTLREGAMTVSELAKRLGVTKQGAGQIVDDMQARGLVRRGKDPHDARARPVELTNRGRDALDAASTYHRRTERRLVKTHGAEAVTTLRALLANVAGGPSASDEPHFRIAGL